MTAGELAGKKKKLVIGLMSGTSVDGIDAALVEIAGWGATTGVRQLGFLTAPFPGPVRKRILELAEGGVGGARELCLMNVLLGELYAQACEQLCRQAGVDPSQVDLVGSHGQTLYHQPEPVEYLGRPVAATLQIGEGAVLAQRLGCPVVSDFRVRDMAAGGLGAPLVPYTEFLLYRSETEHVALQNIGGIGNVTLLPAGCALEEVLAFDTGPGNMVMDALAMRVSDGRLTCDKDGLLAGAGRVSEELVGELLEDAYILRPPPKTTGRERYNAAYVDRLLERGAALGLGECDVLATATCFTARSIRRGLEDHSPFGLPHRLVVAGGGSKNPTLMKQLRRELPETDVLVQEDLGLDSDAKEAVAFAILANEAVHGLPGNAPGATGACGPVVLGKISQ